MTESLDLVYADGHRISFSGWHSLAEAFWALDHFRIALSAEQAKEWGGVPYLEPGNVVTGRKPKAPAIR